MNNNHQVMRLVLLDVFDENQNILLIECPAIKSSMKEIYTQAISTCLLFALQCGAEVKKITQKLFTIVPYFIVVYSSTHT